MINKIFSKTWVLFILIFCMILSSLQVFAVESTPTNDSPSTTADKPTDKEPITPEKSAILSIDNQNLYNGMSQTYSQGYIPTTSNGHATVVLPILSDMALKDSKIRAYMKLGEPSTMPFVCKNYEKNIILTANPINGGATVDSYLVTFDLELKEGRINGNYPVSISITANDSKGNPVSGEFTVYVVISDGIEPKDESEEKEEEPPIFTPKVMITSYECTPIRDVPEGDANAPTEIQAGDKVKVCIRLLNTSKDEAVKNMSVSITSPELNFQLSSPSNSQYIDSLGANKSTEIIFEYNIGIATPPGQYDFQLNYDYSYNKALTHSGSGVAKIQVGQTVKMTFDPLQIPSEVSVGDTVPVNIKAMNLSRASVFNVRAVIEGDGLSPAETAFIGNIEAGAFGVATVNINIIGLDKSNFKYGNTTGTVTYFYEDADGNEYTQNSEIATTVKSPFSDESTKPKDEPNQWWYIMLTIIVLILGFIIWFVINFLKRRKTNEKNN